MPPATLIAVLSWYAAASLAAAGAIILDKRRATRRTRRIPESRLHLLELLGGWPGSYAARHLVRHKTRKLRYRLTLWSITALHLAAWGVWWFLTQRD
ncbi:MAG: DUF1294 domain-containing protein [Phycisphaerales bacterium JB037]